MRILVEPNAHHLENVGDVAMLQVAVERLRELWPSSEISVITDAPELLHRYCPSVLPVPAAGRRAWFGDKLIGNRVHEALPARVAATARRAENRVRAVRPLAAKRMIKTKRRLKGSHSSDLDQFLSSVLSADLVVVSGAGAITDDFAPLAITILDLLDLAIRRGIPAAMFGQGIGPIDDAELHDKAAAVLPRVATIGLRERLCGVPLLRSLGIPDDRIFVTGDDAIELACRPEPQTADARGIGVSLRMARYSGLPTDALGDVREALLRAAEQHNASLVGLPISRYHKEGDAAVIGQVLETSVEPPADAVDVIRRIHDCRLVVTGSYHAGVFALAQGIPVVGLAASKYYVSKFEGLIDQFGAGCTLVRLDDADLGGRLAAAIDEGWASASAVAEPLRTAAKRQVDASRAAYRSLLGLVSRSGTPTAREQGFNCADQDSPSWEERGVVAVSLLRRHLADGDRREHRLVIGDFGAGNERLRRILDERLERPHAYRAYDLSPQRSTTTKIDLASELPAERFDVVFCLGLLEYFHDPAELLNRMSRVCDTAVLSYVLFDGAERLTSAERRRRGWVNDLTRAEVEDALVRAGFAQAEFATANRERTGIWVVDSEPAPERSA